jgi:hypothetical protein
MSRRTWIVVGVVLTAVVVIAVGGLLVVLLVAAFIGVMVLGEDVRLPRAREDLTAQPYDDQAWAREWVRARDKE